MSASRIGTAASAPRVVIGHPGAPALTGGSGPSGTRLGRWTADQVALAPAWGAPSGASLPRPAAPPPSASPSSPVAPPSSAGPAALAAQPAPAPTGAGPALSWPARAPGAPTGSAFLARTASLSPARREEAILAELLAGNVPDAMRQLHPVRLSGRSPDGQPLSGTAWVLPDHLSIGSNEDHVRIPMTPRTAQLVADRLGASLPTTKLVDAIHAQADRRLNPQPLPPGPQMGSNAYFTRHDAAVDAQLGAHRPDDLVSGHKKDLVLSNRLASRPGRVAIYGWHRANGQPIQPLSTVHGADYVDYSHGVRLMAGTVEVNGRRMPVAQVLADPRLAPLLSNEGAIARARYPT